MSAVYGVIRKLGATSKYKGYYYVVDAVEMAQKIYERPVKVTKDIYPVIARKYKSTPSNVEHNIRTLVNLCWMNHKDTLEEMAGCTMADKPTNSYSLFQIIFLHNSPLHAMRLCYMALPDMLIYHPHTHCLLYTSINPSCDLCTYRK